MIELLHLDFYKTEFRKCNVPHGTLHSAFKSRYPPHQYQILSFIKMKAFHLSMFHVEHTSFSSLHGFLKHHI